MGERQIGLTRGPFVDYERQKIASVRSDSQITSHTTKLHYYSEYLRSSEQDTHKLVVNERSTNQQQHWRKASGLPFASCKQTLSKEFNKNFSKRRETTITITAVAS